MKKAEFEKLALSFLHTEQLPHFEREAFKVTGRKMFASYLEKNNTANIFLSPEEQRKFVQIDSKSIFPVPNKWGEKGITTFVLDYVESEIVAEALKSAYNDVISKGK